MAPPIERKTSQNASPEEKKKKNTETSQYEPQSDRRSQNKNNAVVKLMHEIYSK